MRVEFIGYVNPARYHMMETLQMGLVPIYVYDDTPWLPYADLYPSLGFSTQVPPSPRINCRDRPLI